MLFIHPKEVGEEDGKMIPGKMKFYIANLLGLAYMGGVGVAWG